jgi:prepilin-type processing-associated H-X9-DG protein
MNAPLRRGISMIELLVVIAVGGLTLALLLPAVQAARARARDESCVNNLKQIGLAMHNYHDANGALPMSHVLGRGHGVGHSAFTALLPFMELAALYNAYNFHLENWHPANTTAARTKIAAFLCPENDLKDRVPVAEVIALDDTPLPDGKEFGRVHYGANWGGGHKGYGDVFLKEKGDCRGLIVPVLTKNSEGRPTRNISMADITDGTSVTLAFVEKLDASGWAIGGWAGSEFDVNIVINYDGDDAKSRRAFTGSHHEGGPNVLFGDGSVRSLSPQIDRQVWFNLITRNGGEVIKADDF